jgi:hypothetical protein
MIDRTATPAVETKSRFKPFFVNDIGLAAYLYMQGFRLGKATRKGYYFNVNDIKEREDIDIERYNYYNSAFAEFDRCLLTIKRMR